MWCSLLSRMSADHQETKGSTESQGVEMEPASDQGSLFPTGPFQVCNPLDADDQTLRNLLSGRALPSILNDAVFKQCPDNALAIETEISYRCDRATIVDE